MYQKKCILVYVLALSLKYTIVLSTPDNEERMYLKNFQLEINNDGPSLAFLPVFSNGKLESKFELQEIGYF
jgi:hypothetical protein